MPTNRQSVGWVASLIIGFILLTSAESLANKPDSALAFRNTRVTLVSGDMIRSEMVRITHDSLIMYGSHYIPSDASILPKSSEVPASHEMSEIAQLEVSRNHAGAGAGIGFLAGIIAFVGLVSSNGADESLTVTEGAFGIAIIGGIGAGLGAITGSRFHHWETVYVPGTDLDIYRIKYKRGVGYDPETPSADK